MRLLSLTALLMFAAAGPVSAQVFRSFPPSSEASVSVEAAKYFGRTGWYYRGQDGGLHPVSRRSALHSTQALSARVPVGRRGKLVVELPFGFHSRAYTDGFLAQYPADEVVPDLPERFGVGNPFVGADVDLGAGVEVGGGLRLPLLGVTERGLYVSEAGAETSPERREAFLLQTVSAVGHVSVRRDVGGGVHLRGVASPALRRDVRSPEQRRGEWPQPRWLVGTLAYGVSADRRVGPVRVDAGAMRLPRVESGSGAVWGPVVTLYALGAEWEGAIVRPSLRLTSNRVVSVGLTVPVR